MPRMGWDGTHSIFLSLQMLCGDFLPTCSIARGRGGASPAGPQLAGGDVVWERALNRSPMRAAKTIGRLSVSSAVRATNTPHAVRKIYWRNGGRGQETHMLGEHTSCSMWLGAGQTIEIESMPQCQVRFDGDDARSCGILAPTLFIDKDSG